MPEFLVYETDRRPKVFRFAERVSIGRDQGATLVLPDRTVSRLHAVVNRHDTQFILVDKGARNRNLVNGQPVRRIVLKTGDEIQIGRYLLVFHSQDRPESDGMSVWPPTGEPEEEAATIAVSDAELRSMRGTVGLQERARLVAVPPGSPADAASPADGVLLGTRTWPLGGSEGARSGGIPGRGLFAERFPAGVLAWNGRGHVVERESRLVRLLVNGKAVSRLVVLAPGDVLEIGGNRFRYDVDSDAREGPGPPERK